MGIVGNLPSPECREKGVFFIQRIGFIWFYYDKITIINTKSHCGRCLILTSKDITPELLLKIIKKLQNL